MTQILRHPAPEPPAGFTRLPLVAPHQLNRQCAMIALNSWWSLSTETRIAQDGLCVTRAAIRYGNAEYSPDPLPVKMFSRRNADGIELMLAIFADASALVLRSITPVTREMDMPHDRFQVLPTVLRLTSRLKQASDAPDITLKIRKPRGQSEPDLIIGPSYNLTPERISLTETALLDSADAWAARLDSLPALHLPEVDQGYAPEGEMGRRISQQFNLDPTARTAYATPAFLPYKGFSTQEGNAYQDFLAQAARWLLLVRAPAQVARVDVTLMGGQLRQTPGPISPHGKVHAYDAAMSQVLEAESATLTRDLMAAVASDQAPIPAHRLIYQVMRCIPNRTISLTLSAGLIGFSDARRDTLSLSSHEMMALRQRFAPVFEVKPERSAA